MNWKMVHLLSQCDLYPSAVKDVTADIVAKIRAYVDDLKSNLEDVCHDRDAKLIVAKNRFGDSDVSITARWHIGTASFTDADTGR